jgi:hypothetical protein
MKKLLLILLYLPFIGFGQNTSVSEEDVINAEHAARFGNLMVQDDYGRLNPVHNLCSDFLRELYGKDHFNNLSATQVLLGMMNNPTMWRQEPIIKLSATELRSLFANTDIIDMIKNLSNGLEIYADVMAGQDVINIKVSFNKFFDNNGNYILRKDLKSAYEKLQRDRNQYDKDLIDLNYKVNMCYNIFSGSIFRLFPLPDDSNSPTWLSYTQHFKFSGGDSLFVSKIIPWYFSSVTQALIDDSWAFADSIVLYISKFQDQYISKNYLADSNRKNTNFDDNDLAIGEIYQGGIIFYLDGTGGGLIAAPFDQSKNGGSVFGFNYDNIDRSQGISIGKGYQNSINIVANCSPKTSGPPIAAHLCDNLILGGYSDWFLPSKDELNKMYLNLKSKGLGGFSVRNYWSSTEYDFKNAWTQSFLVGQQILNSKDLPCSVRAIRAF